MKMPTDGQIRAILVRFERQVPPRDRGPWRRYRNQLACSALFRCYMRRVRVRGRGAFRATCPRGCHCSRHILEAALVRYDMINPHLYGAAGRREA
jgi:hypothetical protein